MEYFQYVPLGQITVSNEHIIEESRELEDDIRKLIKRLHFSKVRFSKWSAPKLYSATTVVSSASTTLAFFLPFKKLKKYTQWLNELLAQKMTRAPK